MTHIRNYVKALLSQNNSFTSLNLRGLELLCDQYQRVLSIQLLDHEDSRLEILQELGAIFKSLLRVNGESQQLAFGVVKVLDILGKILLFIIQSSLKSHTYDCSLSNERILKSALPILKPIIKELSLSSNEINQLTISLDYFSLGSIFRYVHSISNKK